MKKEIKGVYALKYGQSVLSEAQIFDGGASSAYRPISFTLYLIVTDDRRILVDAGCDTMPGFEMEYFCSPVEILAQVGYSSLDITDLIITHAHHDHIEAAHYFANATVYIQRDEYLRGRKYLSEGMRVVAFEDEYLLGPLKIVKIGGHTSGSSIVKFTVDGEDCVIVGDECYIRECVERGIPTGSSKCPEKSRNFLKEYAHCRLLFCHDHGILPNRNGYLKLDI